MNPMPVDIAIADVDKLILPGGQIPSESSEGLSSLESQSWNGRLPSGNLT